MNKIYLTEGNKEDLIEKERKSLIKNIIEIPINNDDSEIKIIPEHKEIVENIKNNIDLDTKLNQALADARSMDRYWKNCIIHRDNIKSLLKETEGNEKEVLKIGIANIIYFDENCQDLDIPWFSEKILGYAPPELIMNIIKPKTLECIQNNCSKIVHITERKDINLKRCKYHQCTQSRGGQHRSGN